METAVGLIRTVLLICLRTAMSEILPSFGLLPIVFILEIIGKYHSATAVETESVYVTNT